MYVYSFPVFVPLDLAIKWNFNTSKKSTEAHNLLIFAIYSLISSYVRPTTLLLICPLPCASAGTKGIDTDDDVM